MDWRGTFTALVTPFVGDEVDLEGLRSNVRQQLAAEVNGLVALGTTGEAPTLSATEKRAVLEVVLDEVAGRIPVVAGTGSNCTRTTVRNTIDAQELGVNAVLVVTPYYNRPSQDGIVQHFEAISSSTDLPICVYNQSLRTGCNIAVDTMKRLAQIPRVEALKEACGDFSQVLTFLMEVPELPLLSGDDSTAFASALMGASGVISVVSNLFAEPMVRGMHAALRGDVKEVKAAWARLYSVLNALSVESNPTPIKAAMQEMGLPAGPCRLPLAPLRSDSMSQLRRALNRVVQSA